MKERIKVGIIGLGQRGGWMLIYPIARMKDYGIDVVAVCDLLQDRVDKAQERLVEEGFPKPFGTTDYNELLAIEDLDAVYIAVSWEAHVEVAVAAMRAGKYVGLEAGGAYSIDDCYKLIRAYKETGTELMFLENCCFGKKELMVLNMVRKGVLGDIMHCNGAYCHDLRSEILDGNKIRHYRLRNYIKRNCENYPTHEIGPIAKVLNINNGNRFLTLSSFASGAKGLKQYAAKNFGADHPLANTDYAQGDIITTVLTCANGQTVTLTLNTTLPRAYSRRFEVLGTKGMYMEDNDSIFLDGNEEHRKNEWVWKPMWGNATEYLQKYNHDIWGGDTSVDINGHGDLDKKTIEVFIYCVKNNCHPPIDVYDAATYMAITCLSEDSIAMGGAPVAFPDFTDGRWTERNDICDNEFTLDIIDNDPGLYYKDKK